MVDGNEEIQIEDVENWKNEGENKYSHQELVMFILRKCLVNGSVELKEGFWNTKIDKFGNAIRTYEADTRKMFIESVRSLMMTTHRDWKSSEKYKKLIEDKVIELKKRKEYWLNQELKWWSSLNLLQKTEMNKQGKGVQEGFFNKNNEFDNYYFDEETQVYRDIYSLICDFIKDEMKDYEGEDYIA